MLSLDELEHALSCAADLVERHGDELLPAFLLIEAGVEAARMKDDIKARVRARASGSKSGELLGHRMVNTSLASPR